MILEVYVSSMSQDSCPYSTFLNLMGHVLTPGCNTSQGNTYYGNCLSETHRVPNHVSDKHK